MTLEPTPPDPATRSDDARADRGPRASRRALGLPDDHELGPWRAFLHAHARITRRLDDELQAGHGLSLAEYDALIQIATSPGRRLRMNLIAQRVLLSRSGVTRLIDRLVAERLVERVACSTDARGAEAVLTGSGLDRMRAASRTHLAGVQRYYLEVLSPAEREVIERGLGKVQQAAGPAVADCMPGTGEA